MTLVDSRHYRGLWQSRSWLWPHQGTRSRSRSCELCQIRTRCAAAPPPTWRSTSSWWSEVSLFLYIFSMIRLFLDFDLLSQQSAWCSGHCLFRLSLVRRAAFFLGKCWHTTPGDTNYLQPEVWASPPWQSSWSRTTSLTSTTPRSRTATGSRWSSMERRASWTFSTPPVKR